MIYEIAALMELILVILENSGFAMSGLLPLGGGYIQQIGLIFATAYVVTRIIDLLKEPPRRP